MTNQNIVEFFVKRSQLLQHGLLKDPQTDFLHLPGRLELAEAIMEGFADQGGPEGIVVSRGVRDAKFVQAKLELQQIAPILGIRLSYHHPDRQPVLEFALVDHGQLGPRKPLGGGLKW